MHTLSSYAALALSAAALLGCSSTPVATSDAGSPPQALGCAFTFSGNANENSTRDTCARLTLERPSDSDAGSDAGDADAATDASTSDAGVDASTGNPDAGDAGSDPSAPFFSVHFESATISSFQASIGLAGGAAPGVFSSETLTDWTITLRTAQGCELSAGALAVPVGSFKLTLADAPPDADAGTLAGELDATLYLHAESAVDCGPGDTERVVIHF